MLMSNSSFFFFNDTATTEIYTLSLHDALPIFDEEHGDEAQRHGLPDGEPAEHDDDAEYRHREIRALLEGVVLALYRMIAPEEEIEPGHLVRIAACPFPGLPGAPLTGQEQQGQVRQTVRNQD